MKEEKADKIKGLGLELLLMSILMIGIIVVVLVLFSSSAKATYVSGHITSDTSWNASGSPYIAKGDIYVDECVNLTIEPGVIIKFDGNYRLYVAGNLSAIGNETDKIQFTSNEFNPEYSDWSGILVDDTGLAYIDNCIISYAKHGVYMDSTTSNCNIVDSSFSENQYGVYLYDSSNIIVSNITVKGTSDPSTSYGIYLSYSSNINIVETDVSYNSYGIYLWYSTDITMANDHIFRNNYGIYLDYSSDITIDSANIKENFYSGIDFKNTDDSIIIHCNVSENDNEGIKLHYSSNITISNVQLWNNSYQVLELQAHQKNHYDHQVLNSNVDGLPLYYYFDKDDETIEQLEAGAIIIAWSDNLSVNDCVITNGDGITLYYTTNTTITRCNVSHNYMGIYLYYSPNESGTNDSRKNTVTYNTIYDNTYGIKLHYSDDNEITDNNITLNEYGIHSSYSYYNWIYHNNFMNNIDQVARSGYSYTTNYWDNSEEGNYWSDYYGNDANGDSIGDWSYSVSYRAEDYFPLMLPWNGSLPPDTIPPLFSRTPYIPDRSLTFPRDDLLIRFTTNEEGHFEIIIDTDATQGFDNKTDTTLNGSTMTISQTIEWDGQDKDGDYVDDGDYEIQVMIWDKAGNPIDEPYDAGSVSIIVDSDLDGVRDAEDAFPNDRSESEDFDNDGIGDNSDLDLDNDGVLNDEDDFPWDRSEWNDMDNDGMGDNEDPDDNDNGIHDIAEIPLVLIILFIPVGTIYYTNKHLKGKKEEE